MTARDTHKYDKRALDVTFINKRGTYFVLNPSQLVVSKGADRRRRRRWAGKDNTMLAIERWALFMSCYEGGGQKPFNTINREITGRRGWMLWFEWENGSDEMQASQQWLYVTKIGQFMGQTDYKLSDQMAFSWGASLILHFMMLSEGMTQKGKKQKGYEIIMLCCPC